MSMFRFSTAGESHGPGLVALVEGVPAGLELDRDDIDRDLARRQLGHGRGGRMKIETDRRMVWGGLRHGRTLGSPISLLIENRDHANWTDRMSPWPVDEPIERGPPAAARPRRSERRAQVRPHRRAQRARARQRAGDRGARRRRRDRQGLPAPDRHHRSSATSPRSAASARRMASVSSRTTTPTSTSRRCAASTPAPTEAMVAEIDSARKANESLGGVFELRAFGVPPGLGSYATLGLAPRRADRRRL